MGHILAQFWRGGEGFCAALKALGLRTASADNPSLRPVLSAICWFRHRSRRLVILKYSRDLSKEPLLFLILRVLSIIGVLPIRRLGFAPLWLHWFVPAKHARKEPLHAVLCVAGIARLCSGYESRNIVIRAGWSPQAVRELVQLHIHYARWLLERLHVRILRQHGCLLHELSPDWRRRHRAT